MATTVVMPRQGQSVESCIIVEWKKQVGESVVEGDILLEVETDKATLDVPSPVAGVLLAQFHAAGEDVPVLAPVAAVGAAGELVESGGAKPPSAAVAVQPPATAPNVQSSTPDPALAAPMAGERFVSPRARHLAERKGVDAQAVAGSGPGGRIIERDIVSAAVSLPKLTPVARAMVAEGGFSVPAQGSGPGGRVTSKDLMQQTLAAAPAEEGAGAPMPLSLPTRDPARDEVERIAVKGVRKIIAERMLQSLQSTAQLTMTASADARALQAYRKRLKESPETLGLRGVTINDLVLFAVARALLEHRDLNAHFVDGSILQFARVHLGFAVDTPRGLIVPVIRDAAELSLRRLAGEAKRLASAAQENRSAPDDLVGGTFTVTNLGGFGIESFTPVLNAPQVGILGVGAIQLKPVEGTSGVEFVPHLGLSLTINHQVVDGAPGARFLQTVARLIAGVDLLLAG